MQYIFHEIVKSQFHISVLCCPISYIFAKIGQIGPISHAATTRRDMTFYRICSIKHRDICMTVLLNAVSEGAFIIFERGGGENLKLIFHFFSDPPKNI